MAISIHQSLDFVSATQLWERFQITDFDILCMLTFILSDNHVVYMDHQLIISIMHKYLYYKLCSKNIALKFQNWIFLLVTTGPEQLVGGGDLRGGGPRMLELRNVLNIKEFSGKFRSKTSVWKTFWTFCFRKHNVNLPLPPPVANICGGKFCFPEIVFFWGGGRMEPNFYIAIYNIARNGPGPNNTLQLLKPAAHESNLLS